MKGGNRSTRRKNGVLGNLHSREKPHVKHHPCVPNKSDHTTLPIFSSNTQVHSSDHLFKKPWQTTRMIQMKTENKKCTTVFRAVQRNLGAQDKNQFGGPFPFCFRFRNNQNTAADLQMFLNYAINRAINRSTIGIQQLFDNIFS